MPRPRTARLRLHDTCAPAAPAAAPPRLHQRDGHRVAKDHLDGCGCDWRQVKGAQLPLQRQVHCQVAGSLQCAAPLAGDAHQARALGLRGGKRGALMRARAGVRRAGARRGGPLHCSHPHPTLEGSGHEGARQRAARRAGCGTHTPLQGRAARVCVRSPRRAGCGGLTLAKGTSRRISSVAPLLEKQTSRSRAEIMPMSPCSASYAGRQWVVQPGGGGG